MNTHGDIDRRSLRLAQAVVDKIDREGAATVAVQRARSINGRWRAQSPTPLHVQWAELLSRPWPAIRAALLDDTEHGRALRQNNPFCGILSPRERWAIYREGQRRDA